MLRIKIFLTNLLMNLSYFLEVRRSDSLFFRLLSAIVFPTNKVIFGMVPFKSISHKDYCQSNKGQWICIKENRIGYSSNVISDDNSDSQQLIPFPMSDLILCNHHKAYIQGGSGLVLNIEHRLAINDYCAELDDNTSYQDTITKSTKQRILLLKLARRNQHKNIQSGIMLNDRYASNYYHGLYEILIRLLVLKEVNNCIPIEVPIIVDEAILKIPSLKKAFDILKLGINRKICVINIDERLLVNTLWCITPINILRHRLNRKNGEPGYYVFDKNYVMQLRNTLLAFKSDKEFPKKVFITRKNTKHRKFNEDDIFAILEPIGFEKVSPEFLSFEEQMGLFNGAEWIISGAGAAFTNLLFTSKDCKIICVYDNYNGFIPPVFTTLAYFNDSVMRYFKSKDTSEATESHANYLVNTEQFELFINSINTIM